MRSTTSDFFAPHEFSNTSYHWTEEHKRKSDMSKESGLGRIKNENRPDVRHHREKMNSSTHDAKIDFPIAIQTRLQPVHGGHRPPSVI
jgi:hypothetical protein